jgi:hypothetical protein
MMATTGDVFSFGKNWSIVLENMVDTDSTQNVFNKKRIMTSVSIIENWLVLHILRYHYHAFLPGGGAMICTNSYPTPPGEKSKFRDGPLEK